MVTSTTTMSTASNHSIYAQWTANTYTITYNDGVTTKTVTFSSILPGNLE